MKVNLADRKLDARADALGLAEADVAGIFAASDALATQYRLRSTLSDPAVSAEARDHVARSVFSERIPAKAVDIVAQATVLATRPGGLEASVERQGIRATYQLSGDVEVVQDDVFYFARILEADSELQTTLTDPLIEVGARQRLVAELLSDRVRPAAVELIQRAVARRGRTLVKTLDGYVEVAAQIADETVAHVVVAQPLTEAQHEALHAQLMRIYGVGIDIQIEVEPNVLGGVRIQIGDDLIDGTILTRLNEARHRIG